MVANKNGSVLNTMGALQSSMTKTEKRIVDQILAAPDKVNQASLSEVAKWLDVGEATFIRFCRSLGFRGFSDFKMELAIELATQEQPNKSLLEAEITKDDDSQQIALKLQSVINNVINETIDLLNFDVLNEVVKAILSARRLFLFGVGSSGITAEYAKNKFMRIGLQVDAANNNHFMYMQAALMNADDIVIGISHSGYSNETVKALNIAQNAGAKTIAITHNLRSPITKVANYVLHNGNRQGQLQGDSIGTKITQIFVLDLIYALIVQMEEEKAVAAKQKTLNVIVEQRIN